MTSLEQSGEAQALEKEAILPLVPLAVAGLTALGIAGGASDIYSGIREGSVGKTLWGVAQIPLAVGGGLLSGGGRLAKWLTKVPGLGRASTAADKALTNVGGKVLGGAGALANRAGLSRTGNWLSKIGPTGKALVGGSLAYSAGDWLANGSEGGPADAIGAGGFRNHERQPIGVQSQSAPTDIKGVQPTVEFPPMPQTQPFNSQQMFQQMPMPLSQKHAEASEESALVDKLSDMGKDVLTLGMYSEFKTPESTGEAGGRPARSISAVSGAPAPAIGSVAPKVDFAPMVKTQSCVLGGALDAFCKWALDTAGPGAEPGTTVSARAAAPDIPAEAQSRAEFAPGQPHAPIPAEGQQPAEFGRIHPALANMPQPSEFGPKGPLFTELPAAAQQPTEYQRA